MNSVKPTYTYEEIEKVFEKLISGNPELTAHFELEVDLSNYKLKDEIPYADIGEISNYIVQKKLKNETSHFEVFFKNADEIYLNGDEDVQNFIIDSHQFLI